MPHPRLLFLLVGVVTVAALSFGAAWTRSARPGSDDSPAVPVTDPASAAVTSFPGLRAATGEPTLPGLADAAPARHTVGLVPGPFDDRFKLDKLRVRNGVVTGSLTVTGDVSDLLELQVLAGFYDRDGALLGVGRYIHHAGARIPDRSETFRVAAPPRFRGRAVSAAIGVPVLVNE